MSARVKKITEWIIIGLFIAIVASIASILIYRSVISSDWYKKMQTEKNFIQMTEKVNHADKISYVKIEIDGEEQFVYDIPTELFDDISCRSFKTVDDLTEQHEIFMGDLVAVFYEDKTYDVFFITEEDELYWGTLKIECPSLLSWIDNQ